MTLLDQIRAEIAEEVLNAVLLNSQTFSSAPYEMDERWARTKEYHCLHCVEATANQFAVESLSDITN